MLSMPTVDCPGCGRSIPIGDHEAQLTIVCAKCETRIPPIGQPVASPPPLPLVPVYEPPSYAPDPPPAPHQPIWFYIPVLVMLGILTVLALEVRIRWEIAVSRVQESMDKAKADVDKAMDRAKHAAPPGTGD